MSEKQQNLEDIFGTVISCYTRAQAIDDGGLVDVTATASECGFRMPVALSRAAWEECVKIPNGVSCQDEAGRLWDVLWMLHCAIRRSAGGPRIDFELYVRNRNTDKLTKRDLVSLYAHCGPGDNAEPVITIMLPHED